MSDGSVCALELAAIRRTEIAQVALCAQRAGGAAQRRPLGLSLLQQVTRAACPSN